MKVKIETVGKLFDGYPLCFTNYMNYVRNLEFEEQPDYDRMKNFFTSNSEFRTSNIFDIVNENQNRGIDNNPAVIHVGDPASLPASAPISNQPPPKKRKMNEN